MNVKAVITLILGLVFQLAQVMPGAVITGDCQAVSVSCECCEGVNSCHCAENSDSQQKPSPAPLETGNPLKAPAARSVGTLVSIEPCDGTRPEAAIAASSPADPAAGYRGIRLSVAFCTFVI